MLADLKPYPEMKDSGVEWLGEVPAHWEVRRLASIGTFSKGRGGSKDDEVDSGVPCVRYGDLYTTHQYFIHKSRSFVSPQRTAEYAPIKFGDLLFAASGETIEEIGKSAVNLIPTDACCGGDVILFRPHRKVEARFLGYVADCRPAAIQKATMGRGFTVVHIYTSQLKRLNLALPPLAEQAAIVRFLDHADRRIQRYIRAKEKLIALLEEQKQAIVHEAVTGRIDVRTGKPYPAYKTSGVEWIGEVPAHWERKRFKELLEAVDRRSLTGREPLLSLRRDYGVVVYADHFSHPSQSGSLVGFKLLKTGQLVVNRLQANNGLIFCSTLDGLVSPDYSVFNARVPVEMGFLSELCRTSSYRAHFRRESKGLGTGTAGFLRLYDAKFLDTVVFLPPRPEQKAVLAFSKRVAVETDDTVDRARRQLDLLLEYRARLIADVVTGKVDVREAAAELPAEPGLSGNDRAEVEDDVGTQTEAFEMTDWDTCPAVERKPGKVSGAWVFAGTRIPLSALYENLASGATIDEFVEWFPGVDEEQVRAVLEHEAKALRTAAAP
ncbi:MAG: DUF433 domain-containing protein [Deltaproteobacteria bacterium]|nr:DUF433 domain-containing protein [Deltaproteobacteria bacterium]